MRVRHITMDYHWRHLLDGILPPTIWAHTMVCDMMGPDCAQVVHKMCTILSSNPISTSVRTDQTAHTLATTHIGLSQWV